jgi:RNA polymerase sigma-70 factor (ECF subfamily)
VKTRLHRARRLLRQTIQAEVGSVLEDAFPFAGRRCARMTETVLARLGLAPPDGDAPAG